MSTLVKVGRPAEPPQRFGSAPIPHEHGAWVILYAPLVIVFAAFPPTHVLAAVFLVIAVTGIFLARNAFGMLLRRRGKPGTSAWLAIYIAITLLGALPLLIFYKDLDLWLVGALAAALFCIHGLLLVSFKARRFNRSQWGEILAVGALALTAPAAYSLAHPLDAIGWCLWVSCTLYFSSSVFFVKMLLAAAKAKKTLDWRTRWKVGRDCLLYHILIIAVVLMVSAIQTGLGAFLSAIAYVPVVVRAFYGWTTLSHKLPPLKRVGLRETFYAAWFTAFFLAALLVKQA